MKNEKDEQLAQLYYIEELETKEAPMGIWRIFDE